MNLSAGINIVGYHRQALGLGAEARRLARKFHSAGVPVATIDAPLSASAVLAEYPESDNEWRYPNTVSVVTPQALPAVIRSLGEQRFTETRHAGMWYWELEYVTPEIRNAFELVDEIWTGSQFIGNALRRYSTKPVFVVPIDLPQPPQRLLTRRDLGLPNDTFIVLCTFDFCSVFERKNPLACVRGFLGAFGADEKVLLLIKTQNADMFPGYRHQLNLAIEGHRNIEWRDQSVTEIEQWSLISAADVLVSTHRSEGLGLHLLQAIACGTQVIATGYSAPTEFLTNTASHLIDYTLIKVGLGVAAYPECGQWATVDCGHLSERLQNVRKS